MKLDYLHNINVYHENIMRLSDFKPEEATKFRAAIIETILTAKQVLDLTTIDFIESRNCKLALRISEEDEGIVYVGNRCFCCDLTLESYETMVELITPFCERERGTYQMLYEDVDNPTDFLFSPGGHSEEEA